MCAELLGSRITVEESGRCHLFSRLRGLFWPAESQDLGFCRTVGFSVFTVFLFLGPFFGGLVLLF